MMKKALVVLLLAAFLVPAFADDAIVLPQGVMRTRVIPSMTIINKAFDSDGERQDPALGTLTLYDLSGAIEYGATDWLTVGIQWTPGWRFAGSAADVDNAIFTGVNDLFVGGKIQIVGPRGLVPRQDMRFAVTPGVKIPLSQYDGAEEAANAGAGNEFRPRRTDRGAWGFGGRIAFDYIVSPNFYVNLYNQTTIFAETKQDTALAFTDLTVKYGPELIFEVEGAYSTDLGGGVQLGFGLPVRYTWTGEDEIEGTGQDDAAWTLGVGPNVSIFFTQWALPMEFELGYSVALIGENANAANTISLQIKNFLRF